MSRESDLMTIATAAETCSVSRRTIERAIERGELRAAVLGEKSGRRIRREWLDAWIDARAPLPERGRYEEPDLRTRGKRRGRLRSVQAA